jgi:hypothetical protein
MIDFNKELTIIRFKNSVAYKDINVVLGLSIIEYYLEKDIILMNFKSIPAQLNDANHAELQKYDYTGYVNTYHSNAHNLKPCFEIFNVKYCIISDESLQLINFNEVYKDIDIIDVIIK